LLGLQITLKSYCQDNQCFDMCYSTISQNYSHQKQKEDIDSLANYNNISDSITILNRVISYDCKTLAGIKALNLRDNIIKNKFRQYYGQWKFEWSGSNWGTGEIDSINTEEIIEIRKDSFKIIKNRKSEIKKIEVLCINLDHYKNIYLLVKLDSLIWQFYLDKSLERSFFARIDTSEKLENKNSFLYLREYGKACGGQEIYYSNLTR
jgi:hypothetical protein